MRTWSTALGPKGRFTRQGSTETPGRVTCALISLSAALGCSARPGPARVAHQYATGVQRGTPRAYDALSHDLKTRLSPDEFERRLQEDPARTRKDAADVEQALADADALVVSSECGDGLLLEYQDGDWRVAASSLELYSQASPIEAIRTFVRAFRAGRFDILKRLASRDLRAEDKTPRATTELTPADAAELSAAVDSIALALEIPRIEVLGPRARMSYGAGKTIELVLDGPEWKIEDYDP